MLGACSTDPTTPDAATTDVALPDRVTNDGNAPADTSAPTDTPAPIDRPATMDAGAPPDAQPADVPMVPVDVPTQSRRLSIGPVAVPAGSDITRCIELRLGNTEEALVRHIHVSLSAGSHHLIVYRSRATAEATTPTPCRPLQAIVDGTAPIFIAQMPESDLQMPPGVGLTVAANQMIRIEEHFYSPTAVSAMGTVTLDTSPVTGLTRADMMFWGTTQINVPARSMGTARFFHNVRAGSRVFGLTSHTHQLGVRSTIDLVDRVDAPPGEELHRSDHWEEPPLTRFDPPIDFDGAQGLRLVCNYNNVTSSAVRFGENFNNEMCFLWAYYYPSHGFDICFDSSCFIGP